MSKKGEIELFTVDEFQSNFFKLQSTGHLNSLMKTIFKIFRKLDNSFKMKEQIKLTSSIIIDDIFNHY